MKPGHRPSSPASSPSTTRRCSGTTRRRLDGSSARNDFIADEGDCFERGRVELECTFATDDVAKKEEHLRRARDIARRIGSADLEFTALSLEGTCLVRRGRIREGMRRLDEAVAAASSGEVRDFLAVGEILLRDAAVL